MSLAFRFGVQLWQVDGAARLPKKTNDAEVRRAPGAVCTTRVRGRRRVPLQKTVCRQDGASLPYAQAPAQGWENDSTGHNDTRCHKSPSARSRVQWARTPLRFSSPPLVGLHVAGPTLSQRYDTHNHELRLESSRHRGPLQVECLCYVFWQAIESSSPPGANKNFSDVYRLRGRRYCQELFGTN